MAIGTTFLGLLEAGPRHGYDLKRADDESFGAARPLSYGQVYATLARLLKNGLVEVEGVEPGAGPDRKRYAITEAGVTDVAGASWSPGDRGQSSNLWRTMRAEGPAHRVGSAAKSVQPEGEG